MVKLVKLPKSMWKEDNTLGLYYPVSNRIELLEWKYLIHELLHYLIYRLTTSAGLREYFNRKLDYYHTCFRSFIWRKKITIQYNRLAVFYEKMKEVNC